MTLPDREADRLSLHRKSYEAKLALLETIGPKYSVRVYPSKEGRHPTDQMKTTMIRECKTHGKVEVKLAAFVVRGNFACHMCVAEAQAKALRKPERLRTSVTMNKQAHVYIAMSECGNYIKVGYTAQKPEKRVKRFDKDAPILFTKFRYCTTIGSKAAVLESFLKRSLSKFAQTDLGKFGGSTEVFDLTKGGITVSDIITKLVHAIKGKRTQDASGDEIKFTKSDLTFSEEFPVKYKVYDIEARWEREKPGLLASVEETIRILTEHKRGYEGVEISPTYELVEVNKYIPSRSKIAIHCYDLIFTMSISKFVNTSSNGVGNYCHTSKCFWPCARSYTVTHADGTPIDHVREAELYNQQPH